MNNTKTTSLALVAVFMAAVLVVGTLATVATTQSAFAIAKKPPGHADKKTRDNGSGNGNTVTIEECKNRGSASGFDSAVDQECENLICTHPGNNATCTQEGAAAQTQTPTPPVTPTPCNPSTVGGQIATRSDGTCAASIPRSADPEAIRIFEDQCLSIPGATIVVRDAAVTCLFESTPPA